MDDPQFVSAPVVLPVRDILESTRWYERALGLRTVYLHEGTSAGEATNYAIMQRDAVQVHLILDEPPREHPWTTAGAGYLFLQVKDVESVLRGVQAAGVKLKRGMQTEAWGAQAFMLVDPSGNLIRVAEQL